MQEAERYQDMVENMKQIFKAEVELTPQERNLLSVAYKNIVGERRAAWRVLSSIEHKEERNNNANNVTLTKQARKKVESEISTICNEVIRLVEDVLLPRCTEPESKLFYQKMAGDYYRYIAEHAAEGEEGRKAREGCVKAYDAATATAQGFSACNPTRLSLALNHSVYLYEIMNKPAEACDMAKKAFDAAISELESLGEDDYKDATMVLQLLKDNLTLWTTDADEQ